MPVARVGVGLDAIAADIEPYGRIEGGLLLQEQVRQFVMEDGCVFGSAEVAAGNTVCSRGIVSATRVTQRARTPVSRSGVPSGPVQILAGHDVEWPSSTSPWGPRRLSARR